MQKSELAIHITILNLTKFATIWRTKFRMMRFHTKPLIEKFQKDEPNKIDRKNQIKKLPFLLKIETWTWNRNSQIGNRLKSGELLSSKQEKYQLRREIGNGFWMMRRNQVYFVCMKTTNIYLNCPDNQYLILIGSMEK